MINKRLTHSIWTPILILGLVTILLSFKPPTKIIVSDNLQITQDDSRAEKFISHLKNVKDMSHLFADEWILIYHEDNRCTGSTDGEMNNLENTQIDEIITLKVKNDGQGWACETQEPKEYEFFFDVKKIVKNWDRFEKAGYENDEENTEYIVGAGDSDYLKLFYNDKNLIVKMKYSSEDPG